MILTFLGHCFLIEKYTWNWGPLPLDQHTQCRNLTQSCTSTLGWSLWWCSLENVSEKLPWLASLLFYLAFCGGIWSSLSVHVSIMSMLLCPARHCQTQTAALPTPSCLPTLPGPLCTWFGLDSSARHSELWVTWLHPIFFLKLVFCDLPAPLHCSCHGYTTPSHLARASSAFFFA